MSTIRKRGNGQWQAQVRRRGFPLQSKTFPTRAAAERWGKLTEVEMTQGAFVSRVQAESTTLHELLERYIAEVSPTKKGAASEIVQIEALCRNSSAARFLATIRGADIVRYREERLKKVASATVRRDLGVSLMCLKWHARNGGSMSSIRYVISKCRPMVRRWNDDCALTQRKMNAKNAG